MAALIRIDSSYTLVSDRDGAASIRFCSRCGQPSEEPPRNGKPAERDRVCTDCGMGLMLTCSRKALPGEAAAFLVVAVDLLVGAVSKGAEKIFGLENDLLGTPLLDIVTSPMGDSELTTKVARATQRPIEPHVMPVRRRSGTKAAVGTMAARIATCGPPRAALVTVEPSDFGRR